MTERTEGETLPEYEHPPVTEVVYGIAFEPLFKMLAPHFGLLWEKYRKEYPRCEEKPPLIQAVDTVSFLDVPPLPRIWFVESSGNQLIQVQRDRLLHNWREIQPHDSYPRYTALKERFRELVRVFFEFAEENALDPIQLQSAEMSYINHIPFNENGIHSEEDVKTVFPDFTWDASRHKSLDGIDGLVWQTVLRLPKSQGLVTAVIRSAQRKSDDKKVFVFELTARKHPGPFRVDELWDWLDVSHQYIVKLFDSMTDRQFQELAWGRK